MPKVTKKQAAQEIIEAISILRLAGDTEAADARMDEAREAIQACRPQDRKALEADLAHVIETTPQEAPSGAELAISSYHEVEGVDALVDEGAKAVKSAVAAGMKAADMARTIAETLLEARLKMPNKHGLADITALSKHTKNIAHDTFVKARKGVTEEDVERWATHQSLAKAVRNRMSDVLVDRLRALDGHPERFPAETVERARAAFPDLSTMEAIYALYAKYGINLPRKGRTELAREDARRRAELIRKATAGELEAGEGEGSDADTDLAAVERLEKSFTTLAHRAAGRPDAERAKVKARINAVIATLAAEAAKL